MFEPKEILKPNKIHFEEEEKMGGDQIKKNK